MYSGILFLSLSASYRISTLSLNASMGYGQLNNSEAFLLNQYLLITELVTATHLRLNYKRQLYSLDYTRNDL
jgi:hypothetical protein